MCVTRGREQVGEEQGMSRTDKQDGSDHTEPAEYSQDLHLILNAGGSQCRAIGRGVARVVYCV